MPPRGAVDGSTAGVWASVVEAAANCEAAHLRGTQPRAAPAAVAASVSWPRHCQPFNPVTLQAGQMGWMRSLSSLCS